MGWCTFATPPAVSSSSQEPQVFRAACCCTRKAGSAKPLASASINWIIQAGSDVVVRNRSFQKIFDSTRNEPRSLRTSANLCACQASTCISLSHCRVVRMCLQMRDVLRQDCNDRVDTCRNRGFCKPARPSGLRTCHGKHLQHPVRAFFGFNWVFETQATWLRGKSALPALPRSPERASAPDPNPSRTQASCTHSA